MAEKKGIIRRIDDLGRIVIPREYRKLHGIELGDPIEITALGTGEIVLKRVDLGEELVKNAGRILETVSGELEGALLVSDFETYLLGEGDGGGRRFMVGKEIGKWAAKLLKERNQYLGAAKNERETIDLSGGKFGFAAVLPLMQNGDCYGGLYYLSHTNISSETFTTLKILAKLIALSMKKF
ncbi:MAG: AbrB/MazE/SpoVT family DNA-binding domain-containing protein [Clostridiales bacterium]|jgi:AbrB family looped-hinge helix DNA binding protein|nr:AbrB/MazE/SpoVT family DNA-binding domain-containing protein [Clostridiales bacterium]